MLVIPFIHGKSQDSAGERGKGDEAGRILCPFDDLAGMLQEELEHDNNLLRIQDKFLAIPSAPETQRAPNQLAEKAHFQAQSKAAHHAQETRYLDLQDGLFAHLAAQSILKRLISVRLPAGKSQEPGRQKRGRRSKTCPCSFTITPETPMTNLRWASHKIYTIHHCGVPPKSRQILTRSVFITVSPGPAIAHQGAGYNLYRTCHFQGYRSGERANPARSHHYRNRRPGQSRQRYPHRRKIAHML